ncbi:Transcriptional regulator, LysR family [Vulgatibacter incomptus]|uniref:Transcriptional regulator, LysR family n=1 Tax=Vulgatibacter incomptus TaxID=1391653 RepID=A0A0K1PGB8_9BACT|nr:Transcriptional regulator, LysR family [Vulgatibacter incomptus]
MQDLESGRWDDVRVFLAAYRHKSLGAAAARVGVDTSTMSRRLTAFEDAIGKRLFERSRSGLVPTRAAELVLVAAEAMESAYARIARDVSGVTATAEGVVRITADPGVSEFFVAPALARLRSLHPNIDVELDTTVRALDLTRQEADLALRSTEPRGADLLITKLASARWVVAAAPALAKTLGTVSSWSPLPWITWDRDFSSFAPARWLAKIAPDAKIALRTSNFSSQLTAAAAGLGVGLFPEPFVHVRGLTVVRPSRGLASTLNALPEGGVWLVGHRALRDVPRVAAVWEFLTEELRRALRAS